MSNKNDIVRRTVLAPGNADRLRAGDLLSVELASDEEIQWIWCHHGERGSSVIGFTIAQREVSNVPEKRPIGFFPLEERR